jgi:hypothetical protein
VRFACINADEFPFRGTNMLLPKEELSTESVFKCRAVVRHNISCNLQQAGHRTTVNGHKMRGY